MVGNLVLRQRGSRAVKHYFRTFIRRNTSPNQNFEYGYPHSKALLQSRLKLERCEPHKTARHPTDVRLLMTSSYFRLYTAATVYCILSQIFDVIQSDAMSQKQVH